MTGKIIKEDNYRKQVEADEIKDLEIIRENIRNAAGTLKTLATNNRLNMVAEARNIKSQTGKLINVLVPVAELARTQWIIDQLTPIYERPTTFRNAEELYAYLYKPLQHIDEIIAVIDRKIQVLNMARAA